MKKSYTKKQITEAINYWKGILQTLNESEDQIETIDNITTSYCRNLIFDDAPNNSDVKVYEMFISSVSFLRDRYPIEINEEDIKTLKSLQAQHDDQYRCFIYYISGQCESKFSDAAEMIEDEGDFANYIDPTSRIWTKYYSPEEFDEEFKNSFKTYEEWIKYLAEQNKKVLKKELLDTSKEPYESAADRISINSDGIAYTIVAWRA